MDKCCFKYNGQLFTFGEPTPETIYNFDIEMDWSIVTDSSGSTPAPVTDQASFEQWLTDGSDAFGEAYNQFTNIVISDFVMTGNRIQCNLSASGSIQLALGNNTIVNADKIGILLGLEQLMLNTNQIVEFNPSIALPSTLNTLVINSNQIVSFNPSIPLPINLQLLELSGNQMTTAGYTDSETWANAQPSFTTSCGVKMESNIDSVSGTNLETILGTKNCTVTP